MKGRKPKPAELKVLMGNPGKRPFNPPVKMDGVGKPPDDLTEAAKEKWLETVDELGLWLKKSDRSALRLFCEIWAEMLNAQKNVVENGSMVLTPNGMVQKSPWLTKVEQSRVELRKWLETFYATPTARARVSEAAPEVKNPFSALDRA